MLHTPTPARGGHTQYIAAMPDAGDVIVHAATAVGGLLVVSVAAAADVPSGTVLAAAHRIAVRHATGAKVERRQLADLPLGEGPLWSVRETIAAADRWQRCCPHGRPGRSTTSALLASDLVQPSTRSSRTMIPGRRSRWRWRGTRGRDSKPRQSALWRWRHRCGCLPDTATSCCGSGIPMPWWPLRRIPRAPRGRC